MNIIMNTKLRTDKKKMKVNIKYLWTLKYLKWSLEVTTVIIKFTKKNAFIVYHIISESVKFSIYQLARQ